MTGAGTGYVDQYGNPMLPPAYNLPGGDRYAATGMLPPLPQPSYSGPMTLPGI